MAEVLIPKVEEGISESNEVGHIMKRCLEAHPLYFKSTRDKITRLSDSIKMCSSQIRDPVERGLAIKMFENFSQILYINNLVSHCRAEQISETTLKTLLINSERFLQNLSSSNILKSSEVAKAIKDTMQSTLVSNFG